MNIFIKTQNVTKGLQSQNSECNILVSIDHQQGQILHIVHQKMSLFLITIPHAQYNMLQKAISRSFTFYFYLLLHLEQQRDIPLKYRLKKN